MSQGLPPSTILEALPQAVSVIDAEGRLAYANAAFWRSIGLDPATCPIGSPLRDLLRSHRRLALARALLRRPQLLVLDEATSSLDAFNEARVQEAVRALRGKVTLLVIAHRLATVRDADVIYVLDEGRIVESGSWDELMSRGSGALRELAVAQGLGTAHGTVRAEEAG